MTMACDKIQKTRGHASSNDQTNARLTDPFASQRDRTMPLNHSQTNMASQLLFSQPPSNMRHGAPKSNAMTSRVSLNGSSDLLGLLAPSHPIQTNYAATREVLEAHGLPLGESESRHSPLPNTGMSVAPEIGRPFTEIEPSFRRLDSNIANSTRSSEYVTNQSYADIEKEVVDFIAECTGTQPPNESDDHGPARNVGMGDIQPSKKRHRGSTDVLIHNDGLSSQGRQSSNTPPSKKRQRIDAGEVIPPNKSERVQNKLMQSPPRVQIVNTKTDIGCPSATSPWDGMMKIPLSEVHIPKDQAELLEGLKWIPQDPGISTPLCHVPPRLLTQWNNIARRRQHLAEEAEAEERLSERALTSTPQEPSTSPIPWSPSPDRAPARDVLPRDTASPPRYIRPIRGASPPTGTQYSVDQSIKNGDVDMVNGSCSAPQPGPGDIVSSRNDTRTAEQQCSPSPEEVTTKPRSPLPLDHDPDLPQEHNASKSVDVVNDQPPSITQEHDQSPAKTIPLRSEMRDESSSDESDEPEMETYVPFALGGSLPLSSQPEQEPTSSGPSLPRFAGGTIQVVETPAANNTRLNPGKQSEQRTGVQLPSSQQPYSEATKTSPSSRIPNTYRSQDNHGHSDLSQDEPPLMDVLGTQTQTSSVHALSQATVQSSPDVLDSSRPVQRHRGSSIFRLDPSDNPSSFPDVGSHSLSTSQLHELSQHSPGGLDGGSQLPELSPMEFTTSVAAHGESPSKRPKYSRPPGCEGVDTGQKAAHGPNVELVARRQGSIGNSDEYAEAQTVYEKFCNDYSPYAGGFAHFTEMCSKLQAVRQKGQLQRSFLWDDFVIQYLEEYSRYLTEHIFENSKTLNYEDFFCSRFSRPHHKKRSLTAHGIDIVASQFVPPTSTELRNSPVPNEVTIQGDVTQDKAIQSEVANNSFTASLVGRFSNLHAQSFGDAPVPDVCMPTATQSSSSSYPSTGSDSVVVKIEADDSFNGQIGSQNITSSDDQKPVFFSHDEETTDATRSDAESVRFAPDPNDVDMAEADMDEIEETQEGDGTHHETASIELGDDTDDRRISVSPAPPAPPAALGALNNSEPEQPRRRRPWFRSLRNIWPKGPVWSDDPDTPFKRWARQDQNVLQELNRRGGVRVLTDEKGVIRYPTYNRDQDKNPGP